MKFFKKSIKSNKKALLVGINYRRTNSELHGCINDVINMKQMLMKNGYEEKDIKVMTDDTSELPTKHNILTGLDWLLDNEDKKANLLFHYSGHGASVYDKDSDEVDNKDECLIPIDYRKNGMILDDELRIVLQNKMTDNTSITMLIDACHSGTILDLKYNVNINTIEKKDNKLVTDFKVEVHEYEPIKGVINVFSGCEDSETSADAWIDRKSQGAMTYSFLLALRQNEYDLTYEILMNNLFNIIKKGRYAQNPTLSSNKSIVFENKVIL